MSTTTTITDYKLAAKTLRQRDLRQGLYDEGAVLMDGVLVNLHGAEHTARRGLENKIFRRDVFLHYEHLKHHDKVPILAKVNATLKSH